MVKNRKSKEKKHKKQKEKKIYKDKEVKKCESLEKNAEIEKIINNTDDKEQRRITRLGAIIAIVAVIGTVCTVVFKLCVNALNIWAVQGVIYWFLWVVFFLTFSTAIIVFCRLIIFVICDLMRYNIIDENYKKYDAESDVSYNSFIFDSKTYLGFLMCAFSITTIVLLFIGGESDRIAGICMVIAVVFLGIVGLFFYVKSHRKQIISQLGMLLCKLGIWFLVGFMSLGIALVWTTNIKGNVTIRYEMSGVIEMCNTSTNHLDNLEVTISDEEKNIIWDKCILSEDMLYAIERVDIYREKDGNIEDVRKLNTELQHWKYSLNISEIVEKEGKYHIYLQLKTGEKNVKIDNYFTKDETGFVYAVDYIEKEY